MITTTDMRTSSSFLSRCGPIEGMRSAKNPARSYLHQAYLHVRHLARTSLSKRAEPTVDRAVIAHVVAKVDHRRDVERRQPDRIDPERPGRAGQVIQLRADVRQQFTDAVPVAVRPTVRVDLVDHRLPPPRPTRRCCSARHLPDDWWPSAREPRSCDSHVTALVLEQMTLAWQRRAARLLSHRAVHPAVRGVDPPLRGSRASCLPGQPWRSTVDHQLGE